MMGKSHLSPLNSQVTGHPPASPKVSTGSVTRLPSVLGPVAVTRDTELCAFLPTPERLWGLSRTALVCGL